MLYFKEDRIIFAPPPNGTKRRANTKAWRETRDAARRRDAICPNYTALITANYRPFSVLFTGAANRDATPVKPMALAHLANLDLVLN